MASRSFSFDSSAFPSKPSRFSTQLCKSVKRTVSGFSVLYCSKSFSPMSRESCQVMVSLRIGLDLVHVHGQRHVPFLDADHLPLNEADADESPPAAPGDGP